MHYSSPRKAWNWCFSAAETGESGKIDVNVCASPDCLLCCCCRVRWRSTGWLRGWPNDGWSSVGLGVGRLAGDGDLEVGVRGVGAQEVGDRFAALITSCLTTLAFELICAW